MAYHAAVAPRDAKVNDRVEESQFAGFKGSEELLSGNLVHRPKICSGSGVTQPRVQGRTSSQRMQAVRYGVTDKQTQPFMQRDWLSVSLANQLSQVLPANMWGALAETSVQCIRGVLVRTECS